MYPFLVDLLEVERKPIGLPWPADDVLFKLEALLKGDPVPGKLPVFRRRELHAPR